MTQTSCRAVVILGAVVLLCALFPTSASAFWWRTYDAHPCNGNNSADSVSHGFFYTPYLSSVMASATNWARTNVIDPPDINTFTVSSVAFDTDVVVSDQDYTFGGFCDQPWHDGSGGIYIIGMASCVSLTANPAGACEKHEARYDESYTNTASTTQRRWVACHESGHTLGLEDHTANGGSCMWRGSPNTTFSAGDYTNINLFYY